MRMAGRWLMLIPPLVLVILNIVWVIEYFFVRNDLRSPLGLILIFIPFMIPGTALWLTGWIVEGFANEKLKNRTLEH
jgi:hypothetical protein